MIKAICKLSNTVLSNSTGTPLNGASVRCSAIMVF